LGLALFLFLFLIAGLSDGVGTRPFLIYTLGDICVYVRMILGYGHLVTIYALVNSGVPSLNSEGEGRKQQVGLLL